MIYRGREGMWSWIFHRLTGLGVLLFLLIHIIDTMLIMIGPEAYNKAISLYRLPIFRIGEVFLVAAVLYHALNGVRIILVDFLPRATRYQRAMFYIEAVLFLIIFIPGAYLMLKPIL